MDNEKQSGQQLNQQNQPRKDKDQQQDEQNEQRRQGGTQQDQQRQPGRSEHDFDQDEQKNRKTA